MVLCSQKSCRENSLCNKSKDERESGLLQKFNFFSSVPFGVWSVKRGKREEAENGSESGARDIGMSKTWPLVSQNLH